MSIQRQFVLKKYGDAEHWTEQKRTSHVKYCVERFKKNVALRERKKKSSAYPWNNENSREINMRK